MSCFDEISCSSRKFQARSGMFAEGSGCFAEPSEGLRRVLETFGKVLQSLQKCPQVSGNGAEGLGEFWKVSRVSCNVFGMRLKLSAASRNHVREREKVLFRVSTCDNESRRQGAARRVGRGLSAVLSFALLIPINLTASSAYFLSV